MRLTHVDGKDKGKVVLYALSTCMWCKKTKTLLKELEVAYDYVDIDLLPPEEKPEVREQVIKWKGQAVYPCIVINDERCIPRFDEVLIRREFET